MANSLVNAWREFLLADALASDLRIVLVDASYTYSAAHDNLDDITGGARLATSGNLAGKTGTDGYLNSDDVVCSAVPSGDTVVRVILYKHTGTESTSKLFAQYDTNASAAAISVATNDGDITIAPAALGWLRV